MVSEVRKTLLASAATRPPKHKVWRVTIAASELAQLGFETAIDPWEECIKPLMLAKGLPEGFTLDRTPARISVDPGEEFITLEFE